MTTKTIIAAIIITISIAIIASLFISPILVVGGIGCALIPAGAVMDILARKEAKLKAEKALNKKVRELAICHTLACMADRLEQDALDKRADGLVKPPIPKTWPKYPAKGTAVR